MSYLTMSHVINFSKYIIFVFCENNCENDMWGINSQIMSTRLVLFFLFKTRQIPTEHCFHEYGQQ